MNSNLFGVLQQLFRNDAQGLANRRRIFDSFKNCVANAAEKPAVSDIKPEEDLLPAYAENERKKRLREAYRLREIFSKPVSMRDDKE